MEMKPTAPYTAPPAYSSTMPYPGPQPPSYGYPHPATSSGIPNHLVVPPTTLIGSGEVHTVVSNHEPSSMVVTHTYQHPHPKLRISSKMGTLRTPETHTFFPKMDFPSW
ncbi:uncharacterized protein LOC143211804 isoform X2 [Lasioglossum baleicum]|uniref:uncharacterized protein LOC143211804 isoform X2 n=1 Tax=Lasioglossum baleicum TaxID=434251 RepID=UPI003FCE0ACA